MFNSGFWVNFDHSVAHPVRPCGEGISGLRHSGTKVARTSKLLVGISRRAVTSCETTVQVMTGARSIGFNWDTCKRIGRRRPGRLGPEDAVLLLRTEVFRAFQLWYQTLCDVMGRFAAKIEKSAKQAFHRYLASRDPPSMQLSRPHPKWFFSDHSIVVPSARRSGFTVCFFLFGTTIWKK